MTDEQLLEFAEKYRCSHPGVEDWFDMRAFAFVNIARAIEQASRRAALEEAAKVCETLSGGSPVGPYKGAYSYAADQIRALSAPAEE